MKASKFFRLKRELASKQEVAKEVVAPAEPVAEPVVEKVKAKPVTKKRRLKKAPKSEE